MSSGTITVGATDGLAMQDPVIANWNRIGRRSKSLMEIAIVCTVLAGLMVCVGIVIMSPWCIALNTAFVGLNASIAATSAKNIVRAKKGVQDYELRRTNSSLCSGSFIGADPASGSGGTVTGTIRTNAVPEPRERAPRRAFENSGVVIGETIAWRRWQTAGDYLLSLNGMVWLSDQVMDGMGIDTHNSCGVHAFKNAQDAYDYPGVTAFTVVGRVKLWGTIIEHEGGYRAEYARPIEIVAIWDGVGWSRDGEAIARFAQHYGMEGK